MNGPTGGTERELKLGVWPEFELPHLGRAIKGGGLGPQAERRLEAIYFDTADLHLLRRGITLRFRRGEDAGPMWTVKLPADDQGLGLTRREVSLPGESGPPPGLLRDLTRGWALGARLDAVARMVTVRRSQPLLDEGGVQLASIDDDEVAVLRGRQVTARFRELEVELAEDADDKLLRALAKRLRSAGAQPVPQVPKLVHALGPVASEPWELTPPELGPRPSAVDVLRRRLIEAAGLGLVDHHAPIVLDEHSHGVRAARRAVRRFVADVLAFEPLLDAEASRPLCEELRWLAEELGRLERADELIALAHAGTAASGGLVSVGPALDALLSALAAERARILDHLLATLRGPRYRALLPRVAAFAIEPPLGSARARRRAAAVVPSLVRHALRDLRRDVAGSAEAVDDAVLHRLEWPVERLRSAVAAAVPLAGPPARRAAGELDELGALLHDHREELLMGPQLHSVVASGDGASRAGHA